MIKYRVLCGDALHCESVFMVCCDKCGRELDDAAWYYMVDHPSGRTEAGNVGEVRLLCHDCMSRLGRNSDPKEDLFPGEWPGHWMSGYASEVFKFMQKPKKHRWPKEVKP